MKETRRIAQAGISRRSLTCGLAAAGAAAMAPGRILTAIAQDKGLYQRTIPSTGETIPAIGMGSWITFNVGESEKLRNQRLEVLRTFFDMGGAMIDSSPMYGTSEDVIGYCLGKLDNDAKLFSATKVWTLTQSRGVSQMNHSQDLWNVKAFDLMQIHNLLDWDKHIETLKAWKEQNRIRYIGMTTSHGRRHDDLADTMRSQPLDFVQFTYNILDREAEKRLLPLAADRGLAVICNRPFRRGALLDMVQRHPLPEWASEIDCRNWPQFLLKFIVSHSAVTCAIPATTRVDHMSENMGALRGRMPDQKMRRRMVQYVEGL